MLIVWPPYCRADLSVQAEHGTAPALCRLTFNRAQVGLGYQHLAGRHRHLQQSKRLAFFFAFLSQRGGCVQDHERQAGLVQGVDGSRGGAKGDHATMPGVVVDVLQPLGMLKVSPASGQVKEN